MDAAHTQRDTAEHLVAGRGVDYVMTAKRNQSKLLESVVRKCLPRVKTAQIMWWRNVGMDGLIADRRGSLTLVVSTFRAYGRQDVFVEKYSILLRSGSVKSMRG